MDKPSRTVKVNGRGGDFTFDTMLVPLTPEQVERIRREREDTSRHFAKMEFPDSLDKPSRTISSHTVEGTKRETIVLPWTPYQNKHPPLRLEEPSRALTSHIAKTSRDALVPVPDHVMTPIGGWTERSDWGSRVMESDKPAYTITEKHRSGQLVETPTIYRRLTVRECLRLQSFPDWYRFPEHISVSKRYKLVGEAVPPILAYRLAVHIAKLLGWETREPPRPEEWRLPYFHRAFHDYF
jgi:site-specific DNA-cytosine methylase